jgi:hypothetical protein
MAATKRPPTTEMQVTSIRLDTDLKERLRQLSGNQGYQTLIREILWDYVERHSRSQQYCFPTDIQATVPATAQQDTHCAITGRPITAQQPMLLGWTTEGEIVPLSIDSINS